MTIPVTAELASFVAGLSFERLPSAVVRQVESLIIDSISCGVAGYRFIEAVQAVETGLSLRSGSGICSVFGSSRQQEVMEAACINGAAVHALNFDSIGTGESHLGVTVLPLPLAISQERNRAGRDLLLACATAAEVTARLGAVVVTSGGIRLGILQGQLFGYVGAVAGGAKALGFDAGKVHSALGLAAMQTAGSMEVMREGDSPAKAIYAAFPNQAAALALVMAEGGVDARFSALEGEYGILPSCLKETNASLIVHKLGKEYLIEDVYFKPWPSSARTHLHIEAALSLTASLPADWLDGLDSVQLTVQPDDLPWVEPFEVRRHPENNSVAANSIPYTVAVALAHGSVSLAHMVADGLHDGTVANIASRVRYQLAPGGSPSSITVIGEGGTRTQEVAPIASDDHGRSLSHDEVRAKARATLQQSGVEQRRVEELFDAVEGLVRADDLGPLTSAIERLLPTD